MPTAKFEHEANSGRLIVETHFGQTFVIACEKATDEFFRLGGTMVNEVMVYEGVILELKTPSVPFQAFRNATGFHGNGLLSPEDWTDADLHCYVHEYYPLDMEGKPHEWFIAKKPLENAHYIFVNLDILDGGGNAIKRYRVSPFTGNYVVMDLING